MIRKEQKLAELQRDFMNNDVLKNDRKEIHKSWFNESTADYWRHHRMYKTIAGFANFYKSSSWLTIGDGRYGLDAIRLKKIYGLQQIFPTDIAGSMLKASVESGYINNYGVENAEQLSFGDNTYDVIFCKEAFHHFPRPYLALYEMIRVAAEAVVLIEPAETLYYNGVKSKLYFKSSLQLLFSRIFKRSYFPYLPPVNKLSHTYEESGNYLYGVSVRELEKLVHGMDLKGMAYKRFNDNYINGCEFEEAVPGNLLFEKIKSGIEEGDELCRKHPGYYQPNMVSVILFKKNITSALEKEMGAEGFTIINKIKNPYLP